MSDDFVNRVEFDALKEEVNEIKKEMAESNKILQAIDKKIDIISEKIINSDKIDDLKFAPLEERLKKVENGQDWLWKTIIATMIGIGIKVIFDISKLL